MSRVAILVSAILFVSSLASAADPEWPQFLGPDRNGISSEKGLADSWPAKGPKEVWRVAGGVGKSGLAISRGRLITMVQVEGKQRMIALDAKTGDLTWKADLAPAYRNSMGDGPRATPTIAGDRVFVLTGEGILVAVKFENGEVLWSKNVLKDLGGEVADYGMACSPLVVGSQVIVSLGAAKGSVAAFDAKTGDKAWAAPTNDPAGYSSPSLLNLGGRSQVVAFTGGSALGLAPQSGEVLWRYPYETDFGCNIATPIASDGKVFISSGENHGCAMLSLKPMGSVFEATPEWESQGPQSVLRSEWQTSILLDGYLYGMDNVGGAGPVTHLTCVKAATGERVWQKVRFGKGNLIAADGKLYFSMMSGELVLVRATPKQYEELGRAAVLAATRTPPALAGGMLYVRDDKSIVCLDVRK